MIYMQQNRRETATRAISSHVCDTRAWHSQCNYYATGWTTENQRFDPQQRQRYFFTTVSSLRDPPNLLSNGYQVPSPGTLAAPHIQLVTKFNYTWMHTPTPQILHALVLN